MTVLLLNGPNLNLLGDREPSVYGRVTLEALEAGLRDLAASAGVALSSLQSNAEHVLIERVHAAAHDQTGAIVINPGAFGHTSVALRDALAAVALPFFEVHISNIHAREPFRHHTYLSDLAAGIIIGCGVYGYELALMAAVRHLRGSESRGH